MKAWDAKQDAIASLIDRRKSWLAFRAEAQEAGFTEIADRLEGQISRIDVYLAEQGMHPMMISIEPKGIH